MSKCLFNEYAITHIGVGEGAGGHVPPFSPLPLGSYPGNLKIFGKT